MQIECPHCSADNEIEFGENILCHHCKNTFAGHYYKKFKQPYLSAASAFLIGSFVAYSADHISSDNQRYPLNIEFELLDSCVNGSGKAMNKDLKNEKIQFCICMLETTMEKISYQQLMKSESDILTHFKESVPSCL
jgi:hypothetical protein